MVSVGPLEFLISGIVVAGFLAWRPTSRRWDPGVWAAHAGLTLTPDNRGLVRSYLFRTRRWRLGGAVAGYALPLAYVAVRGASLPVPLDFSLFDALVGYQVGTLVAEVTLPRPASARRAARLHRRDVDAYVRPVRVHALGAATVAAVMVSMAPSVVPGLDVAARELPSPGLMVPVILGVGIVAVALLRTIVRRPQPMAGQDVVDADDAIRAASVGAISAAAIALLLVIIAVHLLAIGGATQPSILRSALLAASGGTFLLGLCTWVFMSGPQRLASSRMST